MRSVHCANMSSFSALLLLVLHLHLSCFASSTVLHNAAAMRGSAVSLSWNCTSDTIDFRDAREASQIVRGIARNNRNGTHNYFKYDAQSKYTVTHSDFAESLTILAVSEDDAGTYKCRFKDESVFQASLTVIGVGNYVIIIEYNVYADICMHMYNIV